MVHRHHDPVKYADTRHQAHRPASTRVVSGTRSRRARFACSQPLEFVIVSAGYSPIATVLGMGTGLISVPKPRRIASNPAETMRAPNRRIASKRL